MDCIFKAWGYVPSRRFCTHCQPLEDILKSLGYNKEESSRGIDLVLKAYAVLKADDILRDEKNRVKRGLAKVVKKLGKLRLPEELSCIVERADKSIRSLEASGIGAEGYVRQISAIGGEIFRASFGGEKMVPIGASLSAAVTVHDMVKDRREDKRRNQFNPLETGACEETVTRISRNIEVPPLRIRSSATNRGLPTRLSDPQVGILGGGCCESFYTCVAVCGGICSAILLYRLCCL